MSQVEHVGAVPASRVASPAWYRPRRWAWWVQVLAVYTASRMFSALVLLVVLGQQGSTPARWWGPGRPSYAAFLADWWDGWWYRQIAEGGYPAQLPVRSDGLTALNAWAFYPLYPRLVRVLQDLTGLGWHVVAPAVATIAGGAAMLAVHACIRAGAPRAVAARPGLPLATVAVLCVFPSSIVLGAAYTESLALGLAAGALLLLVRRHYLWALVPVVLLGFTRAVALPLAVVVLVHAIARWRRSRADGVPVRDWPALAVLLVVTVLSGVAWQVVVGLATGVPDAYLRTQEAWRRPRPMTPFGGWTRLEAFGGTAVVVTGLVVLAVLALLVSRSARRLGPELLTWSVAYLGYLIAVADLISSLFRFLLLAFPLAAALVGLVPAPVRRARWWLAGLLVVLAGLQIAWALEIWVYVPGEVGFLKAP
ncbi:MAG: hypothetical protein KJ792_03390 [Actinobacteria bacterium]|nr:hypothetical protein [Actinomycetota bacterium]MCG2803418.1 hypothetical protein [Cellulomonas sp.]